MTPLDPTTRFALNGLLGTAVIIGAAPFIRPATVPAWLEAPSRQLRAHAEVAHAADTLFEALYWTPTTVPKPVERASSLSASPVSHVVPDSQAWGVVHAVGSPMYRPNGKFMRHAEPGTCVIITGKKQSTGGTMLECRMPPPVRRDEALVLMQATALNLYTGVFDAIPPHTLSQCQTLGRLQAELARLKQTLNDKSRTDNPNWTDFQTARAEYDRYWARVKDLQQQFETHTGDERMKFGDELRRLKGEDVRLGKAYEAVRSTYSAWNAAHPRPMHDPRLASLQQDIDQLRLQTPPARASL